MHRAIPSARILPGGAKLGSRMLSERAGLAFVAASMMAFMPGSSAQPSG